MGPLAPLASPGLTVLLQDSKTDPRVWQSLFRVSVFYVHPNRKENRKKIPKIPNKVETNRRIFFLQVLTKVEFKISCKSLTSKFQILFLYHRLKHE